MRRTVGVSVRRPKANRELCVQTTCATSLKHGIEIEKVPSTTNQKQINPENSEFISAKFKHVKRHQRRRATRAAVSCRGINVKVHSV